MAPKQPRNVPTPPGVKTPQETPRGSLEDALLTAAAAAEWIEVTDAAALELARLLARYLDQETDTHAAATLARVLTELGLTVRGRRDRQPVTEDSPLARLVARAARPALTEGRDPAA